MAEEAMNTATEDTNQSQETEEAKNADSPTTDNSADNADSTGTDDNTDVIPAEEEPFMIARYNKEDVKLSKEDAQRYAQLGMHYSNKLNYLAAIRGKTPNELLDEAVKADREAYKASLTEEFGEDNDVIDKLMRTYDRDNEEKYGKYIENQKSAENERINNRNAEIAEEFAQMQKDFPELKTMSDVPDSVIKDANNGISLEHSYLKYLRSENKKIEAANAAKAKAEEASAGSIGSEKENADNNLIEAMMSGIGKRI